MKTSTVKKLSPLDRLTYFITERESIRLKKEAGEPAPWTDDEILRTYRFTNVRRMDDKVSRWLLANWYEPYRDHPNMLEAAAIARFVNLPASLELITSAVFDGENPNWTRIKHILRKRKESGETVFNGAYMVRGNDGIDKVECVIDYYVRPLCLEIHTDSMEETWKGLLPQYGWGSFMAGQVVADLRHALSGEWKDRRVWAPIGPGSKRGMNRVFKRDVKRPLSQEQFDRELNDCIIFRAESVLPTSIYARLEAIDYQNCLCEFDKYSRAFLGEGRPKQLYRSGK